MSEVKLSPVELAHLLTPVAIREKARAVFALTCSGDGAFGYHEEQLRPAVDFVMTVIRENYPDGNIPFHSRWGHFRAGAVDRVALLKPQLAGLEPLERARVMLDLVITSVLLDAGAGAEWSYTEASTNRSFARSEGLGVASYHMFLSGIMSGDGKSLRADAKGLKSVSIADLQQHFQVGARNPLLGVEGRVALLNGLARALENGKRFKGGRPGNIIDFLIEKYGRVIPATGILSAVLGGFGAIWPGRLSAGGVGLGDVWRHSRLGLVPLHKLSQWMTYSLIEPLVEAGLEVKGVEELTGLAEYRNGGFLIDIGLLTLKDASAMTRKWRPESDLIIEWRALTVYLLDVLGTEVQKALGKTPAEFPLAKVLEGGTWWAGRKIARAKRVSGEPPLAIESDGTVF